MAHINPTATFMARKLKNRLATLVVAAATEPVRACSRLSRDLVQWLVDVGEGTRSYLLQCVIRALLVPAKKAVYFFAGGCQLILNLQLLCVQHSVLLLEEQAALLCSRELRRDVDERALHRQEGLGVEGGLEDVGSRLDRIHGGHEFRDHR